VNNPILVTGVGGQVGGIGQKVVKNLVEKNLPVRALIHSRDAALENELTSQGVEVVVGDLTSLEDVHRALKGCKRLYFGMGISDKYLEATVNTAVVAKYYKIECLVNISQMTVSFMSVNETTESPQQKLHWLSEQVLNWSLLPVVHVRSTVFLEHPFFSQWAAKSIKELGQIELPFGAAKTSPIATDDVARVIAEILSQPKNHIGKVYELTGPKSETMHEIANEYQAALGREITYVDIPLEKWRENLKQYNLPAHLCHHIITMAELHRQNRYDRMTTDVLKVTGKPPMSITDWVKMNRNLFAGTTSSSQLT